MAVAILRPRADVLIEVVRSRDPERLAKCSILVDVGGALRPPEPRVLFPDGRIRFCATPHECGRTEGDSMQVVLDHHQSGGAGVRANGVPYAAAGLAWKYFGPNALGPLVTDKATNDAVVRRVDEQLMQYLDAVDNGFDLSATKAARDLVDFVTKINPGPDAPAEDSDAAFEMACIRCSQVLAWAISAAQGRGTDEPEMLDEAGLRELVGLIRELRELISELGTLRSAAECQVRTLVPTVWRRWVDELTPQAIRELDPEAAARTIGLKQFRLGNARERLVDEFIELTRKRILEVATRHVASSAEIGAACDEYQRRIEPIVARVRQVLDRIPTDVRDRLAVTEMSLSNVEVGGDFLAAVRARLLSIARTMPGPWGGEPR
jgi:hypothetical protein